MARQTEGMKTKQELAAALLKFYDGKAERWARCVSGTRENCCAGGALCVIAGKHPGNMYDYLRRPLHEAADAIRDLVGDPSVRDIDIAEVIAGWNDKFQTFHDFEAALKEIAAGV